MRTIILVLVVLLLLIVLKRYKVTFKPMHFIYLLLAVVLISGLTGYRPTPRMASKAHFTIKSHFELINESVQEQVYFHTYYDNQDNMYFTTISKGSLGGYRSPVSFYIYNIDEAPIKCLAATTYTDKDGRNTVYFMVSTNDERVDKIQLSGDNWHKTYAIGQEENLVILLDKDFTHGNFNIHALNNEEKILYYYGYPKDTNVFDDKDYKWHAVN